MNIKEDNFTEAILNDLEGNDIDDAWENFLFQAAHHYNIDLMNGPIEEDDDFPF